MTYLHGPEVRRVVPDMKNLLRILYVYEKESDVIAINEALLKGQTSFKGKVVNSKEKFEKALKEFPAHVILGEVSTKSFSSSEALKILKREHIRIPFILVSDHIPIEQILDLIKAGASDYVNRDRMERLPVAINSALEKYNLEKERLEYISKLESAETRFRALIEQAVDAVVILNKEGKPTYASPSIKRVLGYTEEETLELSVYTVVHPDDRPRVTERMEQCLKNPGISLPVIQCRCKHKNGNWVWYEGTITNMLHNPAINGIVDNFHDITDKKSAELELKESEEKYRFLFEYSTSPKWIFDLETSQILDVNETAVQHYGYSREEFLSMTVNDIKPPEEQERMPEIFENIRKTEGLMHFGIFTQLKKDGSRIKVEVSGHKCRFNNRNCMVIDSFDVTEREKTLQKLKDSEEKLITAQKIAKLGYWKFDLNDFQIYWTDEIYNIFGVKKENFHPTLETLLASIHPDDRENFYKTREHTFNNVKDHEAEYRIVVPDGTIKWIHEKGKFIKDDHGNPVVFEGTAQDITSQKLLELSLEESNLRYEMVSKATSDAIWAWDFTTGKAYWSEGFQTIFGYDLNKIDLQDDFWELNIHPEDRERVTNDIQEAIESTCSNWSVEYRFRKADNTYAYVLDKGFFIRDKAGKALKLAGGMQDITQRKETEEALKISNERYEIVAKATNDSMWDWDFVTNTVIRPAKTLESVLGYTDIAPFDVDNFWQNHVHPDDWRRISERRNLLFEYPDENYWEDEYRFLKPDNSYAIVYDRGYIMRNNDGKAIKMIGASRDISRLKENELQLKKLNEQLEERAKELVASNQELEQFAYVASHDLQEPLRMVSNFLMQIEKKYNDLLDEKGKTYIHFAVDGAKRMRQMILDLLEFSRAGRDVAEVEEVDLNILVKEILELHGKRIEETNAKIIAGELPIMAVPKTAIRQVFQNLISNSLKYNQLKQGIVPEISICAKNLGDHWQFEVKDNGIGIGSEYFEKIFTIFQRLHDRSEYSGTGIGLAITKKIIENLDGKIWIESEIGKGTTFFFTIPKRTKINCNSIKNTRMFFSCMMRIIYLFKR